MRDILNLYHSLLKAYGPQGWWPLLDCQGCNPTSSGRLTGYHPGEYDYPRCEEERFEICVGAILTQGTAWTNVEKALVALRRNQMLKARKMLAIPAGNLASLIRSSGYFNVKARKLQEFCRFYLPLGERVPSRQELLAVWGIGPETADSILLYAYRCPAMVVDAYTRRILLRFSMIKENFSYDQISQYCRSSLPPDPAVYQEFHALMVEHGKREGAN